MESAERGNNSITFKRFGLILVRYLPLLLIILIFEGTFKTVSWYLIVLYMLVRTAMAVRVLYSTGQIEKLKVLFRK